MKAYTRPPCASWAVFSWIIFFLPFGVDRGRYVAPCVCYGKRERHSVIDCTETVSLNKSSLLTLALTLTHIHLFQLFNIPFFSFLLWHWPNYPFPQTFWGTMRLSSAFLVAALGWIGTATGHNILLRAHSRECFFEDLHKEDVMTVTFQTGDREFGGSGNLDINFWVRHWLVVAAVATSPVTWKKNNSAPIFTDVLYSGRGSLRHPPIQQTIGILWGVLLHGRKGREIRVLLWKWSVVIKQQGGFFQRSWDCICA